MVRFRKTAWFLIFIGLILGVLGAYFGWREYMIVNYGAVVPAKVTKILETENYKGEIFYRPEIAFLLDDKVSEYKPPFRFKKNEYMVGDDVPLYISNYGIALKGFTPMIQAVVLSFVSGTFFFILGWVFLIKQRVRYDKKAWLKRYGKKIEASFLYEEEVPYKLDGETGYVLFFKEYKGKRVFQSNPVFIKFTIRDLRKQLFDVYIHPKKEAEYYIDLEKLFGVPRSYPRGK